MSVRNDPSMRFFKYVTTRYSDRVKSYFDLEKHKSVAEYLPRICQLGCFSKPQLLESFDNTSLGPHPLKLKFDRQLTKRKILVPQFTPEESATIQELLNDSSVKFLIFPMVLLEGTNPNCIPSKKGSKLKHMVLIAYNKSRHACEIWDDRLARVQKRFGYDDINDHVMHYFAPALRTFSTKSGKPLKVKESAFPMLNEHQYPFIREVLMETKYAYNYGSIYSAFLSGYIHVRLENVSLEVEEVCQMASPMEDTMPVPLFIELYAGLLQHNEVFEGLIEYEKLSAHSDLLSEKSPCPSGHLRNTTTGVCEKVSTSITVPKHYRICDDKVGNMAAYFKYIMMYFLSKHPNMATIVPKANWEAHPYYYAIRWVLEHHENIHGEMHERYQLKYPDILDDFMQKSFDDNNVRFIVLILMMTGRDVHADKHANVLIVDKETMTVERYEPNQGYTEKDYQDVSTKADNALQNGSKLDNALRTFFKRYDLAYIEPDNICPIGLNRHTYRSMYGMVEEIGGHCLTWTIYYIDLRLSNPDIDSCTLHQYAIDEIRRDGSFQHFINGYNSFMIRITKKFKGWRSYTLPTGKTLKPFPGTEAAKRRSTQQLEK